MFRLIAFIALWGISVLPVIAVPLTSDRIKEELVEANFIIVPRENFAGSYWIIDQADNNIVGYAPWDAVKRRWTLFNLLGQYQGFIQATIGSTDPPHFKQYLWYDKHNAYKGVFIAKLGGRPTTPDLPFGELGGELIFFDKGNIPLSQPSIEIETDPLKRFPDGLEVEPVPMLPGK